MANLTRTVEILFNGKDGVSGPLSKINKAIDEFDAAVGKVTKPLAEVADYLFKFEAAAVAVAGVIGGISLKNFQNYEYAIIDLKKVLSDAEKDAFGPAEERIKSLARTYGISATELVKRVTEFKRASFDMKDSLLLTEEALNLTSAANSTMEKSTGDIISILKGFNMEASETAHVVDVINIISDKYATTAEQLGSAIGKVAPLAKLAGFSLEELAAVVTPTIEIFRDGDEAGTAWRRAMSKVIDNSAPVISVLKDLNITQRDVITGALRPARDILFDIAKAFETATKENQIFIASEIFGNRQTAKILASLRDLNYVLEIESVAAGVTHEYTMEQVQRRWESFKVQLDSSIESMTQASIALGSRLSPAAAEVAKAVGALFGSLEKEIRGKAFNELFDVINEFGAAISEYLLMIGRNLPDILKDLDFSSLTKALRALFAEIGLVFDDLDIKTPKGITDFLQNTINLSGSLVDISRGVLTELRKWIPVIGNIIDQANSLSASERGGFGQILIQAKAFEELGTKWYLIFLSIKDEALEVADAIYRASGALQTLFASAEVMYKLTAGAGLEINSFGSAILSVVKGDFKGAWNILRNDFNKVSRELDEAATRGAEGLYKVAYGMRTLSTETKSAASGIVSSLATIPDKAEPIAAELSSTWKTQFGSILDTAKEFSEDLIAEHTRLTDRLALEWQLDLIIDESDAEERARMLNESAKEFQETISARSSWEELKDNSLTTVQEVTDRLIKSGDSMEYKWKEVGETIDDSVSSIKIPDTLVGRDLKSIAITSGQDMREGMREGMGVSLGLYTDKELAMFLKADEIGKTVDDKIRASYKEPAAEVEPPADEKFKAAQALLLEEVRTNADVMKSQYSLLSESIKADADTITASIESITGTFQASTSSVTDLYKLMADPKIGLGYRTQLSTQIQEEEQRQRESFELQRQLTEAQIQLISARAKSLESGDALITVSGDGLQPHLEAFMWEILSAIQVRVSESYNNFLLGINT